MAEEEAGQLVIPKVRKLPHQVIADVREVLSAYKSIVKINPEQDSGFLIKHFRKLLETDDENPDAEAEAAENELDPDYDMLEKIRAVFRAFKTFCKWDVEGASCVFLKNLDRILLGNSIDYGGRLALTASASTEIEPSTCIIKQEPEPLSEYEEAEEEEIEFGAVTPYALEIEDGPSDGLFQNYEEYDDDDDDDDNHAGQLDGPFDISNNSTFQFEDADSFNHHLEQYDDEEEEQEQKINISQIQNQIKFKGRPIKKVTVLKKPPKNNNGGGGSSFFPSSSSPLLPDLNKNNQVWPCLYCKRPFGRLRSKSCHERYCAQKNKGIIKYGQLDRITPTPARNVQVVLKKPNAAGLTTAINVSEAISYATSETLRKSGTNTQLSLVPGTDGLAKRYQCHLCPMKNFTSLVHLANHIRTHTQERPFVCPHFGCSRASSDSFNFRRHLRLHNKQKGQLVSIVRKTIHNATNLNMSSFSNNPRVPGILVKKFPRLSAP